MSGSLKGSIAITASLGYPPQSLDALADPNQLFVLPGQTASATVIFWTESAGCPDGVICT